jgi:lysylphosphatidylglycerol synthetase-like protein (DUF2156 family)
MAAVTENPPGGDDRPLERFPSSSRVVGIVTLVALVVVVVLVLFDGVDLTHWAVVAAVVLFGLGVWLTMVRPTVHVHEDHVLVRNALTDTAVPWHLVEGVEVRQVLVIRAGAETVHGIAVGRSARQQLRKRSPGTRPSPLSGGLSTPDPEGGVTGESSRDPAGRGVHGDYADLVAQRLGNLAEKHRRRPTELDAPDKQWRWPEVIAVAGVAITFALLVLLAVVA